MDPNRDFFELDDDALFGKDCSGWVIVTSHAQSFIGRLDNLADDVKFNLAALQKFMPVTLDPAFEFAPLMVQVPRQDPATGKPSMGFGRQPFVSTPHFTTEPVRMTLQPTSYYLFSDMKESDQKTYKGFVRSAISQAKQERLARSNLVAPTDGDLRRVARASEARGA